MIAADRSSADEATSRIQTRLDAAHNLERRLHPITLHNDPSAVSIDDGAVFYRGEYIERPITVVAALDDLLVAEPQLDGEPIEWTVRLAHHIQETAYYYVEAGREPEEVDGAYRLKLTRDDLIIPRKVGSL